jgi:serine/threonine protein kinase
VHPGATIIHRDLKPDNVGFTASGQLKLFDFGLCTCVRQRRSKDEAFEMTGNTGSLRYMAPEVALRQASSEKIDVYSFGIMVWLMARYRVPFIGMDRGQFMSEVVLGGDRPKWVSSFGHNLHLSQSGIPLPWPYTPPLHSPLLQQA